jgi:serine/threonine protein kinase
MNAPRGLPDGPSLDGYDLMEKIGVGGLCEVYRGRQQATGQLVAIKVLSGQLARNEVLLKRFDLEFRAASKLDHPNIVRALDFSRDHPTPFLVLELVEGESLGAMLEREGRLPEKEATRIIVEVCKGLQYAHQHGVIHRDIKPDNILLTPAGEVKITDLGLVKERELDLDLTRTGRGLGTPHFMAPEQFRNAKTADARADIYSLGATLYAMVTGTLPFGNSSPLEAWMRKIDTQVPAPRSLLPTLSERINRVICRALEADPNRRPPSCAHFVRELTGQRLLGASDASPGENLPLVSSDSEEPYLLAQRGALRLGSALALEAPPPPPPPAPARAGGRTAETPEWWLWCSLALTVVATALLASQFLVR